MTDTVAATSTAAAARSLIFPIDTFFSVVIELQSCSIAVLKISVTSTSPMHIQIAIHSKEEKRSHKPIRFIKSTAAM